MNHNLEKNLKRWLKRKVSITLAALTIFAINGTMTYAATTFDGTWDDEKPKVAIAIDQANDLADIIANKVDDANTGLAKAHEKADANEKAIEKSKTDSDAVVGVIYDRIEKLVAKDNKIDVAIKENKDALEHEDTGLVAIKALADKNAEAIEIYETLDKLLIEKHTEDIAENKKAIDDPNNGLKKAHEKADANTRNIEDHVLRFEFFDDAIDILEDKGEEEVKRSTDKDGEHDAAIEELNDYIVEVEKRSNENDEKHGKLIDANKDAINHVDTGLAKAHAKADANKAAIDKNKNLIGNLTIADREIEKNITTEKNERKTADAELKENIEAEKTRSMNKDKTHDTLIGNLTIADREIEKNITTETNERKAADAELKENIEAEKNRSINKDKTHDALIGNLTVADREINKRITTETNERKAADELLEKELNAETERSVKEDEKHDELIAANKDAISNNTTGLAATKKIADANKTAIANEVKRSTAAEEKISTELKVETDRSVKEDQKHDAAIQSLEEKTKVTSGMIEENRSKINHLDKKVNKGTAMLVAMANVDFQNLNEGEIGVAAGVGSYSGEQAVAVGVAYAINEDLKAHAKWSGVVGDPHYNAIGGGISYKFRGN